VLRAVQVYELTVEGVCKAGALKALIGPFHVRQKPVSSTVSGSWVNAAPLAELE